MLIRKLLTLFLVAFVAHAASGQAASNVRAYSAQGQVFVVWNADTANPPTTYEIYFSILPMTSTAQAVRVGRLFEPEWRGEALETIANAVNATDSTFQVPTGAGSYRLAANEGLFVFTPRSSHTGYFAVVPQGQTTVAASERSPSVTFAYQPLIQPVRPQRQLTGVTPQGNPYTVYAVWTLGDDDPDAGRPDYPVSGNAAKNGAPNLFCIYEPAAGLGLGPYPCVIGMHGGEGNFQFWRPGLFPNIGLDLNQGILVAPSDHLVYLDTGQVRTDTTRWFGYADTFDPFSGTIYGVEPPANAIVVDYTCRRFDWFMTWLLTPFSGYSVDRNRISAIGHSMGGRGANIMMRRRPARFASIIMLTPALELLPGVANTLTGSATADLPTNVVVNGQTVHYVDVNRWVVPLSADPHLAFTRIYSGRNDAIVPWDAARVQKHEEIDDLGLGWQLFWDSRVHVPANWDDPPVAEFVSPVRTDLASLGAQHRFRANQSFPGFFDVDVLPATPGIQPPIGDGSPGTGTAVGTWGGYCEWDAPIESPKAWSCDLYIRQGAASSIDNWPGGGTFTCKVRPQRIQVFKLAPGGPFSWTLRRLDTNALLGSGVGLADSLGRPTAPNVTLYPEFTTKVRLEFRLLPTPKRR